MMETCPIAFCEHCQQQGILGQDGACPSCGEVCVVLPEQVEIEARLMAELIRLNSLFLMTTRLESRGSMELGESDYRLVQGVMERTGNIPSFSRRDVTDVVLVNELPKLDIVVMVLTHRHSREEVVIHHGRFSDRHYGRGQRESVSAYAACEDRLLDEVFAAGLVPEGSPCFAENAPGPLRFCHLRQALALLQAHNSLWYAALRAGFYTMLGYQFDPSAPPPA